MSGNRYFPNILLLANTGQVQEVSFVDLQKGSLSDDMPTTWMAAQLRSRSIKVVEIHHHFDYKLGSRSAKVSNSGSNGIFREVGLAIKQRKFVDKSEYDIEVSGNYFGHDESTRKKHHYEEI